MDSHSETDIVPTGEERNWAMAAHAGQVVAIVLTAGVLAWLVPLVVWLAKRDQSRFVAQHALEALNFQITLLLAVVAYTVLSGLLICVGVGVLMLFALPAVYILIVTIFGLSGSMAASRGEGYRYPYILRLVS